MRTLIPLLVLSLVSTVSAAEAPGKPTYERLCISCHAADGKGDADMAKALQLDPEKLNLGRPEVAGAAREDLKKSILDGKNKMQAFAKRLEPAEVDPLVDYVLQLSKAIRAAVEKPVKTAPPAKPDGVGDKPAIRSPERR